MLFQDKLQMKNNYLTLNHHDKPQRTFSLKIQYIKSVYLRVQNKSKLES